MSYTLYTGNSQNNINSKQSLKGSNLTTSNKFLKNLFNILMVALISLSTIVCKLPTSYGKSNSKNIEITGDILQVINPVCAAVIASQERGMGHFAIIYGQNLLLTHGIKNIANKGKWSISKRPKNNNYQGMPSGHTASAWSAAAYVRTFSDDYKNLSIPLYITATITGYSRIKSKQHSTKQVLAAVVLTEAVTFINSKLEWSNTYRSTNISFGEDGALLSLRFKF